MKKLKYLFLLTLLILAPPLLYLGCGGGGDNGGGQNGESTTINGQIANVMAMNGKEDSSFKFAEIMKTLSFIKEARAQGGIVVTAIIDGIVVDTDVTDADGFFTLSFFLDSVQNVTLEFDINGSFVSVSITVQEGTVLNIIVTIDLNAPPGDEVEIIDDSDVSGPIECENGTLEITKNPGEDLVIDGGGEDCIRTAGNCNLIIDPEDIIFTNCENCIDARGTSDVFIGTFDGHVFCDAFGDGIKTVGNASVTFDVNGDINVSAAENGAKAQGNSVITFSADTCAFDTGEDIFDTNGNATINAGGCGEIIEGPLLFPLLTPEP